MIKMTLLAASLAAGLLATARDATATVKLRSIFLAPGNGGNLLVVGNGAADGLPYLASWQSGVDGSWNPGFLLPNPGALPIMGIAHDNQGNLQVVGSSYGWPYSVSWQSSDGTWYPGSGLGPPHGTTPDHRGAPQPLFKSVAMAPGSGGNLQVVGILQNGLPYLAGWWGSGTWHAGGPLPSHNVPLSSMVMAPGNGGNLQVVGIQVASGSPYLASWQDNGDGTWRPGFLWEGGVYRVSSIAMARGNAGNLQVVGIYDSRALLVQWQDSAGGWHYPSEMVQSDASVSSIAMANGNAGNLQVVGLGKDDGLPYLALWQDNGGDHAGRWHSGSLLPNRGVRLSSFVVAAGFKGNLQVIGIGAADGLPYLASWQSSADGSWYRGSELPLP